MAIAVAATVFAAACGNGDGGDPADTAASTEAPFSDQDALVPTPTSAATNEQVAATPDEELPISITEIDFEADTITITNHGTVDVELGDVWLCEFPKYENLDAMVLAGGDSVTIPNPHGSSVDDGELALYRTDDYVDPDAMLSYVHWGTDDHTRTPVAVDAALWEGEPVVPGGSLTSDGRFATDASGWSPLSSRSTGSTAPPSRPPTTAPASGGSPTTSAPGSTPTPTSSPPPPSAPSTSAAPTTTLPPDEY